MQYQLVLAASRRGTSSDSTGLIILIVTAVGVVMVWGAIFGWDKWLKFRSRRQTTPLSLFADLCKVHKLGRSEANLLGRILAAVPQKNPAMLFVDPAVISSYGESRTAEQPACESLVKKLFQAA